ncbi:hypothetical protein Gorai_004131 [Gossypium raimondii]|uniref:ZF-HD dimerization-type domain-containing protein n=1 Tax=Gossypium raimondii TaxID=29730 RepID=A0A7J8QHB9_GOSRA|nr:hypothetical protein [Gossypium raimondii]
MSDNKPISTSGDGGDNCNKVVVRYKECLKNHAVAIGGNATDGCGEFMANGKEGSLEALICSACNCHRNFHQKETECSGCCPSDYGRKLMLGHLQSYMLRSSPQPMTLSYKGGGSIPSETNEKDDGKVRKRFRTKFSQAQKEKMLSFAEKAGWRIQKLDENAVQQFCQEIGIKRRVLKESYCVDQKGRRNGGVTTFVYEEAVKHAKNVHARYLQVFVKQNPKLIRATKHPRRAIAELKFPPKWLEEKHTSTNLADQPDEDKEEPAGELASVAPKVPTVTSLSSNLEGFKKRMVDHITASIESHNRVIAKLQERLRLSSKSGTAR